MNGDNPLFIELGTAYSEAGASATDNIDGDISSASIVIDALMYRGAKEVAPLKWGRVPERAQYALFLLAVAFTWLMGLMGYIRSGIRQHWHVTGVFRDASPDAFTPTLGYAANVVSAGTVLFMAALIFVFWVSQMSATRTAAAGYWKE